ncbi:MAG: hypothetical protein OXH31_00925 [Gammaproteobacteria bacterium]|nr:hypothetical protein [Gammaproteobacteria bacterium]
MSKSRKRTYLITLTVGLVLCAGVIGTILLIQWENSSREIEQNTVESLDDRGDQDGLVSNNPELQPRFGSKADQTSLSELLRESEEIFDSKRDLLRTVDGADEDELVGMFLDSLDNPIVVNSINSTRWMQSVVLTKLVNANVHRATSMLDQLDDPTAKTLIFGVMREWNRVHLPQAIKLLAGLEDSLKKRGFQGLIDSRNFLSRAKLFEIGNEIGFDEKYLSNLLDQPQTAEAALSWKELEKEFENVDVSDSSVLWPLSEKTANHVLAEGLDTLPAALELFDKLSQSAMSNTARLDLNSRRTRVVAYISNDDPESVFEFVVQLNDKIQVDLLSAAAEVWFEVDPDALWTRLSEPDLKGVKRQVTQNIIRHWSFGKPEVVLHSLEAIPSEYHDQAYLDIAQGMWYDSPFEGLRLLPYVSDWSDQDFSTGYSVKALTIQEVISNAAEADPMATLEWINSDESQLQDSLKQNYFLEVFNSWAKSEPEKAFEVAVQTPLKDGEVGLEATVVKWLTFSDVDQAMTLLPGVREGESRKDAYQSVAWGLEKEDRIADAIHLGKQLSELEREEYLESLAFSVGRRTPFGRLEAGIHELPTQELKSEAASTAIHMNGLPMQNDLTDQQIDQLKEFLTDDDRLRVDIILERDKETSEEQHP